MSLVWAPIHSDYSIAICIVAAVDFPDANTWARRHKPHKLSSLWIIIQNFPKVIGCKGAQAARSLLLQAKQVAMTICPFRPIVQAFGGNRPPIGYCRKSSIGSSQ